MEFVEYELLFLERRILSLNEPLFLEFVCLLSVLALCPFELLDDDLETPLSPRPPLILLYVGVFR